MTLEPTAAQRTLYDSILRRHVERQRLAKPKRGKEVADEVEKLVGSDKDARNVFVELRKAVGFVSWAFLGR